MTGSLEITTSLAKRGHPCPNSCRLCPQDALKSAYQGQETHFTLDTLKKALATVPKTIAIHFSGFVEPFFNPETPEMIRWVQREGYETHLFTTLIGMPPDIGGRINHSVPHELATACIHVPDQRQFTTNEDGWIARHKIWRELGLFTRYMAMGPVSDKIGLHMASLSLPIDMPPMRSRAGNLWDVQHLTGPIRCGDNRMHSNVLLPNGDVQLCCEDYSLEMPLGNLFQQSYAEIWSKAEEWRVNAYPSHNSPCRTCEHGIRC